MERSNAKRVSSPHVQQNLDTSAYQDQENIVDSKWVFKTKYKSVGSIERRKARLVAKGFQQTHGIDYEETFSCVVKASRFMVILSIAVYLNWEVGRLDINNVFLSGYLKKQYSCINLKDLLILPSLITYANFLQQFMD